jgi:hypothetical protein
MFRKVRSARRVQRDRQAAKRCTGSSCTFCAEEIADVNSISPRGRKKVSAVIANWGLQHVECDGTYKYAIDTTPTTMRASQPSDVTDSPLSQPLLQPYNSLRQPNDRCETLSGRSRAGSALNLLCTTLHVHVHVLSLRIVLAPYANRATPTQDLPRLLLVVTLLSRMLESKARFPGQAQQGWWNREYDVKGTHRAEGY